METLLLAEQELNNIKQTNNCGAGRGPPPDIWDDLKKKKQREKDAREKAAKAAKDAKVAKDSKKKKIQVLKKEVIVLIFQVKPYQTLKR